MAEQTDSDMDNAGFKGAYYSILEKKTLICNLGFHSMYIEIKQKKQLIRSRSGLAKSQTRGGWVMKNLFKCTVCVIHSFQSLHD